MLRIEVKKPKMPPPEADFVPQARGLNKLFRTAAATDLMFDKLDYFSKHPDNDDPLTASNAYIYVTGSRIIRVRPYLRVEYAKNYKDFINPGVVNKLEIPLDDIWQVGIPSVEEVRWKFEKIKTP